MKLLLAEPSYRLVKLLDIHFPGTQHVTRLQLHNKTDREIWNYAKREGYLLVTFDSDFYDMSITYGHPPKLLWIKTGNLTSEFVGDLLLNKADQIQTFSDDHELSCLEIASE